MNFLKSTKTFANVLFYCLSITMLCGWKNFKSRLSVYEPFFSVMSNNLIPVINQPILASNFARSVRIICRGLELPTISRQVRTLEILKYLYFKCCNLIKAVKSYAQTKDDTSLQLKRLSFEFVLFDKICPESILLYPVLMAEVSCILAGCNILGTPEKN